MGNFAEVIERLELRMAKIEMDIFDLCRRIGPEGDDPCRKRATATESELMWERSELREHEDWLCRTDAAAFQLYENNRLDRLGSVREDSVL